MGEDDGDDDEDAEESECETVHPPHRGRLVREITSHTDIKRDNCNTVSKCCQQNYVSVAVLQNVRFPFNKRVLCQAEVSLVIAGQHKRHVFLCYLARSTTDPNVWHCNTL